MPLHRADLHIHTTYSDGLLEPEDAVNYAVSRTDLRLIAITDHNTLDGARHAQEYWRLHRAEHRPFDVILGEEVSSREGHILGLFLQEPVAPHLSAEETVRAIHEQGGIAIAAHPFTHLMWFTDLKGVGGRIADLPLDGVEVRNSVPTEFYANYIAQAYNARYAHHTPVGGSDCHYVPMIGRTHTLFEGSAPEDLREAVRTGRARAGGTVNGPVAVARFVRDQIRRHRLPLIRSDDHHYRYEARDLMVDVEELQDEGIAVLHCQGAMVQTNAAVLKADLDGLLQGGLTLLAVDLAGVRAVDGAGLGVLLSARWRAESLGGEVALGCPSPAVALTIRLQHLAPSLMPYETVDLALAALRSRIRPAEITQA